MAEHIVRGTAAQDPPAGDQSDPRVERRTRSSFRSPAVLIGVLALVTAIVTSITLPPSLLSVALGFIAVVGLSREPRLGPLPAALLALIAIPYGRAADNDLAELAGIPFRFQDGVVLAAGLLALPALRHISFRTGISRLIAAFLVVGLVAVLIGAIEGQANRDILRDVRWWALYGFGLLALWAGTDRRAIVRGLLIGATVFAVVLFLVVVLPVFSGGLEARALVYDWGRLRLQFSNSIFLIPALAYLATRLTVRPSWRDAGWLTLLFLAVVLSVTRMSILAGLATVGLAFVWAAWTHRRSIGIVPTVVRGAGLALLVVLASVVAVGSIVAGARFEDSLATAGEEPGSDASGDVVDRILFQDPNSSIGAIERGRFATYRSALDVIRTSPILGSGLGTLVAIDFTFGGSRPSTPGMQPGVDDAYLTVAMKTGVIGLLVYAAMMAWPLWAFIRRRRDRMAWWFIPGWLGVLGLSLTQSFATTGYGPFGLALLLVLLDLRPRRRASQPA